MSLGNTIRKGIAWSFAGSTGTQVINFIVGIVLARLLTPADFGVLATIGVFTGLAGFFAGGGMGDALVRGRDVTKEDYDAAFTLQVGIGLTIFAVFFFSAPHIAAWYRKPEYADYIRVSALSFLCRPFLSIPGSILRRAMRFKAIAAINLAALVLGSAISIGMALAGFGVWSLIASGLLGSLFAIVCFSIAGRWRPGLTSRVHRARDLATFGALMAFDDFLVYVRSQMSSFILSKTLGPQALGLFNKANSLALTPHGNVTGPVYQVTFRALAAEADNIDLSRYLFLRSVGLVSFYTWPIFAAFFWLGPALVEVVYGEKWAPSGELLSWFALVGPFIALEILAGSVLAARNWLKREIPVQAVQLVITVLGIIAGLPHGLLGVAIGASLSNVYGALHMTWLATQSLQLSAGRILRSLAPAFALTVILVACWGVADLTVWQAQTRHGALYVLTMGGAGALLYAALFCLLPIEALRPERDRWLAALKSVLCRFGPRTEQDKVR